MNIIKNTIGFYFNILAYIYPKLLASQGFNVFCTPFAKKLKPYQSEFLSTGKNYILHYQDLNIQTYKWGNGSKKILLIHGWASHSFRWKSYIQQLVERDFTVYALDAPAHGNSSGRYLTLVLYTDIIHQFIHEIGNLDAILGHSIGGYATLYWLYLNPEETSIKAAILAAPGEVKDFFLHYQTSLKLNPKAMKILSEEFIRRIGKEPSYFSASKFAQTIQNTALIVHDKHDKDTDYKYSIKLHEAWKNSELLITEGYGHSLKNKELENKILNFLESDKADSKKFI